METKPISRKDFLKYLGNLFLAPAVLKLGKTFNLRNNVSSKSHHEAKYYKSSTKLAG